MATLVTDPLFEERIRAERHASGADQFDEVWEGVLVMSPMADNEHQTIFAGLTGVLQAVVAWPGLGGVQPTVNISDRDQDWTDNYRIPDISVFLRDNPARNHGTFWQGGPDLLMEILSPDDKTREKLPFYASIGTREVLLIDRDPWALELYRLDGSTLTLATRHLPGSEEPVRTTTVPLLFSLEPSPDGTRPLLLVTHPDGQPRWTI